MVQPTLMTKPLGLRIRVGRRSRQSADAPGLQLRQLTPRRAAPHAAADCLRDDSAASRMAVFAASLAPCAMLWPSSLV
jgi:hypothetical protein